MRFFGESKKPDSAPKKPEQEKAPVMSEKIKNLYEKGKFKILTTLIFLGVSSGYAQTSKTAEKDFTSQNKITLELLKKQGLGEDFGNKINDKGFIELIEVLSEKMNKDFINSPNYVYNIFKNLNEYYKLESTEDFKFLADQIKKIKISEDDLFGGDEKELRAPLREKVEDSIYFRLDWKSGFDGQQPDEFLKDPALSIVYKLKYEETPPLCLKNFPDRDKAEWIMRTARNMYISKTLVTPEEFERVFYETIALQMDHELLEKDLFKNRNVAVFAHNQKLQTIYREEGKEDSLTMADSFIEPQVIKALESQKPECLKLFRAENSKESLENTKKEFSDFVINNKEITIIVNAHGGPHNIFMSGDYNSKDNTGNKVELQRNDISVSDDELAKTFEARYDNGFKDTIILLMGSCYNQNFIRNLYDDLLKINEEKNKDIPMPICAGVSEYGQYGFIGGTYGDFFLGALLKDKTNSKIKDIILLESGYDTNDMPSNISIFAPKKIKTKDKNNKEVEKKIFYQIAQNAKTPLEKVFAMQYAESLLNADENATDKNAFYYEYSNPEMANKIKNIINSETV